MKSFLNFFSILDNEGNLSISNLAVIVVLVKLAIAPTASLTEAGALLVTLANYAHKRIVNQQATNTPEEVNPLKPQVDEMQTKLEEMSSQVSALSIQSGIKRIT